MCTVCRGLHNTTAPLRTRVRINLPALVDSFQLTSRFRL